MDRLTKEQGIVLAGFTGVCCGYFGDFHKDVEKRLGRSVMTHEIGFMAKEIKELYRADFLRMMPRAGAKG